MGPSGKRRTTPAHKSSKKGKLKTQPKPRVDRAKLRIAFDFHNAQAELFAAHGGNPPLEEIKCLFEAYNSEERRSASLATRLSTTSTFQKLSCGEIAAVFSVPVTSLYQKSYYMKTVTEARRKGKPLHRTILNAAEREALVGIVRAHAKRHEQFTREHVYFLIRDFLLCRLKYSATKILNPAEKRFLEQDHHTSTLSTSLQKSIFGPFPDITFCHANEISESRADAFTVSNAQLWNNSRGAIDQVL